MSNYISSKKLNVHDMRPRFDDDTYNQILAEAACMDIKPNVMLRMLTKAALKLPREERIKLLYQN